MEVRWAKTSNHTSAIVRYLVRQERRTPRSKNYSRSVKGSKGFSFCKLSNGIVQNILETNDSGVIHFKSIVSPHREIQAKETKLGAALSEGHATKIALYPQDLITS